LVSGVAVVAVFPKTMPDGAITAAMGDTVAGTAILTPAAFTAFID